MSLGGESGESVSGESGVSLGGWGESGVSLSEGYRVESQG